MTGELSADSSQVASWQATTTAGRGTPLEATTTRAWDASTRTWTLTSAEGRTLDDAGRAVSVRP